MRTRLILTPLAVLLALSLSTAADASCASLSGDFVAVAEVGPTCDSPVFFCTHGTLTGDLEGSYDFRMTSQTFLGDLAMPQRFTFTGESVITLADGRMFGDDTGRMDVTAGGQWPFETIVNVVGGDGAHAGAKGRIVATGALDLQRGVTEGAYVGTVCYP